MSILSNYSPPQSYLSAVSAAGASYSSTVPSYPAPITSAADSVLGEGRSVIKVRERTLNIFTH